MSDGSVLNVFFFIAGAFGVSAILIVLAQIYGPTRDKAKSVWPLYASEFLIVALILIPAALGGTWLWLAALALTWRGLFEMFRLFEVKVTAAFPQTVMLVSLPLLLAIGNLSILIPLALLVAAIALSFAAAMDFGNITRAQVLAVAVGLVFPTLAAALTVALLELPNGFLWLVFAYATVEINDAFALLCGKLFGKRRILPKLSPGKTGAGLAGGLGAGAVTGYVLARWLVGLSDTDAIAVTLLALTSGLIGDLATSLLKRSRGKKDFPSVLRQHGGVLDIYDSLLFAAPVILLWRVFA